VSSSRGGGGGGDWKGSEGNGSRDINTAALLLKDPAFLASDFTTGLGWVTDGSGLETAQHMKVRANEARQLNELEEHNKSRVCVSAHLGANAVEKKVMSVMTSTGSFVPRNAMMTVLRLWS
jgi:hypothetical protein